MATMPVEEGFYVTSPFGPRWGTTHWGTDFGRDGGSGGYPIFAVRSGTVNRAGPASGFGQWITIDHPAEVGGGTSVYGHIIPEVPLGAQVREGQRIGRINPDSATNGGVPPHLHFEFHRSVWVGPGPNRLNPMETVLKNAGWPGKAQPERKEQAVIYGVDVSNHQPSIDFGRIAGEGFQFAIVKATEGTWKDPYCRRHIDAARAAGVAVGAYVYVRSGTSARDHASALHQTVEDTSVPIALDIEDGAGGDVGFFRAIRDEIEKLGYKVILTYLPSWYWKKIGSPDLSGLPPLWTSWYPDMKQDYASVILSRSGDAGWRGYGGLEVAMWQFTSSAKVAGHAIDANAFRGSAESLRSFFDGKGFLQKGSLTMDQADRIINELKEYIDVRVTNPIGSDVKDVRQQLTGGRDKGQYPGWAQLGQNGDGENLTVTDAIAALRQDVARLSDGIKSVKGVKNNG